ncbi:gamma-glutamylcyclotransferase [Xanthobacter autotrophicus]|uniref:gamma-glutamylcyclotransferase n=1 Tax=Xanthobacter TaxID=279 RepID=UPI0024AC487B|nr:gamma-glutamylcyclotransferase [Xanthobacter autotrophicus]MDI4663187.1 gamma-glutamylcyclotransferase [Xanthobacter autotrophicus]
MKIQHLTRELIESGGIDAIAARDAPALRVLTDAERAASLRATLDARPDGDAWLFAYGSLIWNPTVHALECRTGRIEGWHRAFCLTTLIGRGTPDNPGLTLGLDEGGACAGVALRIDEDILERELAILWRREMLSGAYVPRWLDVFDADGVRFGSAISFTINRANCQYAGGLPRAEIVRRLASASGAIGSAAEYLFQTCAGLRAHGIPDPALEALADEVAAARDERMAREG